MSTVKYGSFLFALLFSVEMAVGLQISHSFAIKHLSDSFVVTCQDGKSAVTWSGPRGPLDAESNPRVESRSYGTLLYFTGVTGEYSGNYTCKTDKEEKIFQLTVQAPLTFMDTSPVQKGREHTNVTLRCEVKGGDKPIVSWYVEGKELKPPKYVIMGDGLLIKNVTMDDSKIYICKATQSSTGDVKDQEIKLIVQHKPYPRLQARVVTAWGYVGAKVNLTCEGISEPPPDFDWYRPTATKQDKRRFKVGPYKSVMQINIKNKSDFGDYMCNMSNKYGTFKMIYNLQEGVPPHEPEFIELRGANADLLDLGIHGPKIVDKDTPPIGFDVQYRKAEGKHHWKSEMFNISQDNSYPLRNLHHDTKYEIRAATRNVVGLSQFTNTSIFMTLVSQADCAAKSVTLLHLNLIILLISLIHW